MGRDFDGMQGSSFRRRDPAGPFWLDWLAAASCLSLGDAFRVALFDGKD
jgi:hypothetical protein